MHLAVHKARAVNWALIASGLGRSPVPPMPAAISAKEATAEGEFSSFAVLRRHHQLRAKNLSPPRDDTKEMNDVGWTGVCLTRIAENNLIDLRNGRLSLEARRPPGHRTVR